MIVRPEQMKILDAYARGQFVAGTAEYVRALAPKLYAVAGEAAVLEVVEQAISRAGAYGLTRPSPVQLFVGMICTLGNGFDSDPQFAWAHETLTDKSIPNDLLRASSLHDRLRMYLDKVTGPENEYAIAALDRMVAFFETAPRAGMETAMEQVLGAAAEIYPQKLAFVGEAVVRNLALKAEKDARHFELPLMEGTVLLAGLQFALGHSVCSDPLYRWISSTLAGPSLADGAGRATRLRSKLRIYAQYARAHLQEN